MRILSIMCLIAGIFASVFAQTNAPTEQKTPAPSRTPTSQELFRQQQARDREVERSFENLRNLENRDLNSQKTASERIPPPPPPKISKEQAKILIPESADLTKFEAFLKTPKTGLIKLFPDLGCEAKYVVNATENCRNMIPRSSYYSFRKAAYSSQDLSDIYFKDDFFMSSGTLAQGIIVALGDVEVEGVSITSDGLKFLSEYVPAQETKEFTEKFQTLTKGVKDGNYLYASASPVTENTTYAIRVIAYKGSIWIPAEENSHYDLLEGDKRVDLIAVFRVVRKDKDGILTLLWKELQRKDAPKIKISKEDKDKYKTNTL